MRRVFSSSDNDLGNFTSLRFNVKSFSYDETTESMAVLKARSSISELGTSISPRKEKSFCERAKTIYSLSYIILSTP
jgi:hypothetical protein